MQINKKDVYFITSVSLVFCTISAILSFTGMFLPGKILLNPIAISLNAKEVAGHFVWGLVAGAATFRVKYALLGGSFAVLIDSDHLIALLQTEAIPRMSHSIIFAAISAIVLMAIFGRRDYILGTIAATSVATHISYDIFNGGSGFPLFTPFLNSILSFPKMDWIFFEIAAIIIIAVVTFLVKRKEFAEKQKVSQK